MQQFDPNKVLQEVWNETTLKFLFTVAIFFSMKILLQFLFTECFCSMNYKILKLQWYSSLLLLLQKSAHFSSVLSYLFPIIITAGFYL